MSLISLAYIFAVSAGLVDAEEQPQLLIPRSILEIKTPQLIGIIAGVAVFVTTLAVVFCLFYKSGSAGRFIQELQGGSNDESVPESGFGAHQLISTS